MKSLGMHDDSFRKALGFNEALPQGGQELILPEILSLLIQFEVKVLWLPYSIGPLARTAKRFFNIDVVEHRNQPDFFDALYFGTPTIVDGKVLFPSSAPLGEENLWGVEYERRKVRELCGAALDHAACRLIVSGLGTGDISEMQRVSDMNLAGWSAPRLVAWKDFGDFRDSVFSTHRIASVPA